MTKSISIDSFWRIATIASATLAGLAVLPWAAPYLFAAPGGRWPASMVGVVRSHVVVHNPGVNGYYEELFAKEGNPMFMGDDEFKRFSKRAGDKVFVQRTRHGAPEFIYDSSFRIYRFQPNLKNFQDQSQPQGLTTNSFGILGREFPMEKPPNTRRVALLGDSMTQGWGNDQDHSYGRLLENRLNTGGGSPHFEVLNFAVPAYELTQILDVAREDVPRYQPDVYLLALTELAVGRTWNEHLIRLIQSGRDLKYDFLNEIVRKSGVSADDDSLVLMDKLAPYRLTLIRDILTAMKAHAAAEHVPFVVVLLPSLEDGHMSQKRLSDMPALLASLNIPVVDLEDTFDPYLDLEQFRINPSDVHPNTRGHAMLCDKLYTALKARPDLLGAPGTVASKSGDRLEAPLRRKAS